MTSFLDLVWAIAALNVTPTLSLNEVVRLTAGSVGVLLHTWLLIQSMQRRWTLMAAGLNGALLHVARTRIENEATAILLQALMFAPAVVVMNVPPTATAQTPMGLAIIWSQAAVSVILTGWAWRRHRRSVRLDELLDTAERRGASWPN